MTDDRLLDPQADARVCVDAPAVDVSDFSPSDLTFTWDEAHRGFVHRYPRDFQLFAVWSSAREHDDEVLNVIGRSFRFLAQVEVHWSPERVVRNFERLYGLALTGSSGKHEEAGTGPFLLVVAEDPDPVYRYRQNVSGYVELTNVSVAAAKKDARQIAGGYTVHSSNNLREFFRDATLILGPERLDEILARKASSAPPPRELLRADLVGDTGWADLGQLASVLRRASEYVVLRNFESLPDSLDEDPEIDVLARDRLDFAAVVNADPLDGSGGGSQFGTRVAGCHTVFDVRWVGDGYLDRRWQDEMLRRRRRPPEGLSVPRADDYFFSLLYHTKIQKPEVKPAYLPRLRQLALELDLPDHLATHVTEDAVAATILDGFLAGHGYDVPRTVDRGVHRNSAFVALLERTTVEPEPRDVVRADLWHSARHSWIGERAARSGRLRAVARRVKAAIRALPALRR